MIKNLFQTLLAKTGKNYQIAAEIPNSLILRALYSRIVMVARGFFKLRKKVFLGPSVLITNKSNISFGRNVTIERNTRIDGYASQKVVFGNNCKIGAYSHLTCTSHFSKYGKGLTMGNNSAIGDYTHFGASGGIEIGDDVIMGSYVSFHSENHVFTDPTQLIREQGVTSKGIRIGNNVWVGAKVTFLDGAEIGNNSVVAAGAVVNGVFPDNVVVGGVPAKIIKTID